MLENTHIKIVRGNDPTTFNLTIQELIDGDYEDLHDIILGAEIKLFTPSDKYYVVSNEHILVDGNILSFSILTSSMEYAKYSIDITLITSTDQRHSHISNCFELVSEDSEFQSADYVIGNEANLTIYIAPDVDYITFGKTELQNYYTKDVINQKLSELSEATMNAISNIDLSPFATKTELSDAVNNAINSINLTPYATKEWVALNYYDKMQVSVEVTEWVNDQHFVKESQLSNLNYASNEYVTEVMGNLRAEVYTRNQVDTIAADLSSELSATLKQWVLDQGYSTEGGGSSDTPTEWTNYYTKSETDNRIATAVTNGTKNFYTKSEISYIMPKKLSDLTDDLLVQYVKKSDQVKIVRCSQSEYDASTKDNNTIYVIE